MKPSRAFFVSDVQRTVAELRKVPVETMSQRDGLGMRERQYACPRQEAMYLCRKLFVSGVSAGRQGTAMSYPQIGRRFGSRHHTTVMSACQAVERRMLNDPILRDEIHQLETELGQ